jgi:hypothetical protein
MLPKRPWSSTLPLPAIPAATFRDWIIERRVQGGGAII